MPLLPYMLAAVLLGVLVAFQPLANAILARAIGSPYGAAAISIAVAGLGALAMIAVTGRGDLRPRHPRRRPLVDLPRRLHRHRSSSPAASSSPRSPGRCSSSSASSPASSAARRSPTTSACFGVAVRSITLVRLLGLALVLGGAVLVQRG